MTNKISQKQLNIIIGAGFTLTKIYVMPAFLAKIAQESICLCALINLVIDFLLLLVVLKIIENTSNATLFDTGNTIFSSNTNRALTLFYAIFFITKAFVPIVEQKNSIELTFYETQPTLLTFMPFFIVAFYIIIKGFTPFGRSYEMCLWVYLFGIISILALSLFAGKYTALLPIIGENPLKIFIGSLKSLIWFGDPIYILFFAGYIANSKGKLKGSIKAYLIYALTTLIILAVFYAVFETIAPRQYYATLKMSKYSIALSNIGRFDYISAFMLAAMCVFEVCLPLLFANLCLNKCFNFKKPFVAPLIIIVIEVAFAILTENVFLSAIDFFSNYIIWFFIIMNYVIPLIFYLKTRRKQYDFQTV
ncbi:MAG: GerAB/ArcD/ProY family transporter [Clostridia bacterium]|nr:GerAB/ArcD/ProY family transporter [Clostridia bacterium]